MYTGRAAQLLLASPASSGDGFGVVKGAALNSYDTALAIAALKAANVGVGGLPPKLTEVLNRRRSDQGWSGDGVPPTAAPDSASDKVTTAEIVRALAGVATQVEIDGTESNGSLSMISSATNPVGEKVIGLRRSSDTGGQGVTGLERSLRRSAQPAIAELPLGTDGAIQRVLLDEGGEKVPYLILLKQLEPENLWVSGPVRRETMSIGIVVPEREIYASLFAAQASISEATNRILIYQILALLASLLFVTLAVFAGCGSQSPPAEQPTQAAPAPEVEVITARSERVANTIEVPGRLQAVRIAEVRARVNGIVERRLYEEGTDVKEGQPLFAIDPRELRAQLDAAQAALARAQATAANAGQDVKRYDGLVAQFPDRFETADQRQPAGVA